jgi:triosephosphate isomerase
MRTTLIAGNWKMNLDHHEAIELTERLCELVKTLEVLPEISVHPSFTSIRSVQSVLFNKKSQIVLGAQNCHWETKGAFTGEVSVVMLKKLNVKYVIIGHSERRIYFNEDDAMINKKLLTVFENEMIPILCVGETKQERDQGAEKDKVASQLKSALDGINRTNIANLVIAYEPLWAIGTGVAATEYDAQQMALFIREQIASLKGNSLAQSVRILYGGSVSALNTYGFLKQPDIDGALVGGASLNPEQFFAIIQAATSELA